MKLNQHIEEYLDYYCDFKNNLPFAVLLKGRWGCGKTYFIKNYIKNKGCKYILHISLYGINNTKELKDKIAACLIPLIPKKFGGGALKFVKKALSTPKIKEWIPDNYDDVITEIFLMKTKKYVFIFDDFERYNMEIGELLGYINGLIEFKNQKVLIVANEEEVLKSNNAEKYRKIKEKIIGKEFAISPSPNEAIEKFVSELQNKLLKDRAVDINRLLLKIFKQSECDNLRLIQQALSSFEYYYNGLSSESINDNEFFEKMFYEFVVIFIEYKKGAIKSDDFFGKYPHFFKDSISDKPSEHFLDKYDNISHWLVCFEVSVLGRILQGVMLQEIEKEKMINNFEELVGINKQSWQKLWDYYEYSDEEFFNNLSDVQTKWDKKEYEDLFVVMHVFGLFLGFSENGLMQKSKEDILNEGKDYIEHMIKANSMPLDLGEKHRGSYWDDSAYGLGYSGKEYREWKEFITFIVGKINDLKGVYIKQKISDKLMPILRGEKKSDDGLNLLMNYNFLHNQGNKEAYFQFLNVEDMVEIIVNSDRGILSALQKTFIERYGSLKDQIKDIDKENIFLIEFKIGLENKIKIIENSAGKKTPRSILILGFINNAIKPFISE